MAFPGAASVGAVSQAQATTLAVAGPASAGNYQIAILACSTGSETLTVPTGWTLRADLTITSPTSPDRGGTGKCWVLTQDTPSTASQTFTKSGTRRLVGQRISWSSVTSAVYPSTTATSAATASNAVATHTTAALTPAANTDTKLVGICVVDLGPAALVTLTPPGSPNVTVTNTVTPSPAASESEIIAVSERSVAGAASPTAQTMAFTTSDVEEAFLLPILLNGTASAAPTAPTVSAGADVASHPVNSTFTRTATESDGGSAITSRAWTLVSAPAGVTTGGVGTAATLSYTPTVVGNYTFRYTATNAVGTSTPDDMVLTVDTTRAPGTGTVTQQWLGLDAVVVKTSGGSNVQVGFSTSSTMASPVYSTDGTKTPDASGVTKHALPALTPDTPYWYQVESGGGPIGTAQPFTSLPAAGVQQSFTFGFSSCRDHVDMFPDVNPTALADMMTRGVDFFLEIGDFHYRDINSTDASLYRAGYDELFTRSNIANVLKGVPTGYVWDDHDYCGDNSNGSSTGRATAQAVYRERVPHPTLPSATGGIYHTFVVGRVRFIMLDCRSFRSPVGNTDNSSKTMLGSEQKTWLQNLLNTSTQPMTVIVSSVGWIGAAGVDSGQDHWAYYTTERAEIGGWITANAAKTKCVIISGDAHMLAYDDGTNSVASVPQYHAAALNQSTSTKGGPYSGGSRASSNAYGYMSVVDSGSQVSLTYSGYYDGGTLWKSHTTTATVPATVTATATAPLGALTAAATATTTHVASAAAPLGALTATASADVTAEVVTATATAPLGDLTAAAVGTIAHTAAASAPLGSLTATAAATVTAEEITATAAADLGALTATAAATTTRSAVAAATLGGLTGAADATTTRSATASADLGGLTAQATAVATGNGEAAGTAPLGALTATATAGVAHTATVAASLGGLTATAAAITTRTATGNAPLGGLTAAAAGTVVPPNTATAAASLGGLVSTAQATVTRTAVASAPLGQLTGAGIARVDVISTAHAALGALTAQASAGGALTATATAVLGALTATAHATPFTPGPDLGPVHAGVPIPGPGLRAGTPVPGPGLRAGTPVPGSGVHAGLPAAA